MKIYIVAGKEILGGRSSIEPDPLLKNCHELLTNNDPHKLQEDARNSLLEARPEAQGSNVSVEDSWWTSLATSTFPTFQVSGLVHA